MKKNHLLRTLLAVFAALFVIIQTVVPVKAEDPSVKVEKTVYYLRMGESVTGKYTVKGSGKVTVHPAEELYGGETKICTVSQGSGTYTIKASKDRYGTARIPISIEGGNEEVILVHVYQDDMFYLKYLPEEINVLASNEILYLFPEYAPHSSSEMPVTITSSDDSIAQPRLSVMPLAEMAITLKKAGTVTVTFKAKTFERTMKLTVLPEGDYAQSVSEKNGDGFIYLKAGEKIKNPFIMKSDEGTCKDDKVKVSYLYVNQSDIVKIGSDGSLTGVTQGYAEIIGTSLLGGRSYVTVCVYNAPEKLAVTDGPFYVNQYNRFDKHPIIYSVPGQESDLPLVLTSSNPKAVKINEGRSMEYVAPGTAVIRAAYEKDPNVYVEFKVTAYKAKEPDSIKVAKEVTLYPGFGLILNPEFSPARSLESFTEAKSSDSSVAEVMAMENGLMLSGYKKGTATITLKAGSKAKATIKVTVKDGKPDCKKHVTVQSLKDYPYYSAAKTKEITDSKEVIFIKDDMYSFYAEADFAPYVCLGGSDQIGVDFSKAIENTGLFVYLEDDLLSASSQSFTAVPVKTGKAVVEILPGVKVTFRVIDAKDVKKVTMYRLYNQTSGEHFYTAKEKEKDALVSFGWKYEGIGWTAPSISNQPVYRLYNEGSGDHHYSMKAKEKDFLVSIGWKYEGIGWYSDDARQVPLYREYNPNMEKCNHNYTTNKKEHIALTTLLGWNDEGIGWYGLK